MPERKSSSWERSDTDSCGMEQTGPLWDRQLEGCGGRRRSAIKLRAKSASFALEKSITVDLRQTPYLEWEWKETVPPTGGDFSSPDTDDQAAQFLFVFPKTFFERRKVISYIWDPTAPKETTAAAAGPIYLNVKAVVVESGDREIGTWLTERRNIVEDFRTLFGDARTRCRHPYADQQSAYKISCRSVLVDDTVHF